MKKYASSLIFFVTMLISLNSAFEILLDINYQNHIKMMIHNHDSQQIYYALDTDEGKDYTFVGVFNEFKRDEAIDSKIASLDGVSHVYPYTIIKSSNHFVKGKGDFLSVKIDGELFENALEDGYQFVNEFLVVPYYPEDHYDDNMEKVFITKELAKELKVDSAFKPFHLEVACDIPKFSLENGIYKKDFSKQTVQLDVADILDNYYSSIERSEYAILVPYQKIMELTSSQYDLNVVYTNQKLSMMIDKIQAVDSELDVYCGSHFFENTVKPTVSSTDYPNMFAQAFVIVAFMILNRYLLKHIHILNLKQGVINFMLGLLIASFITQSHVLLSSSASILWISLIFFVVSYALIFGELHLRTQKKMKTNSE